ncbi:hypothetical protein [Synergistes jonesii]|uniref:Uncharacterized protein n=1 Tax=Synergistes jonesii TaxID=2754 RepID=A0A073INS6_9BACT|nr:hypothetical protein [Synergistes jonesii]KEJ91136.1 hypothetical protein EH55_13245 [Synergistes jonesii]OFB60245.1 hypothetical protein JS73_13055 [Synergistes jonesii]OFB60931.1 hypothetical protein JS79_12695 [Synergistes jonesii]OFB64614.1 hypothetical protein JS72_03995 [Synergistes jonesii]OFB66452.1 hypothetical protein JS78_13075 [Synergistes jonesii]
MAWAEPVAYGELALKPREFERLQPHEYYALCDGYEYRQRRRRVEVGNEIFVYSYFVAHLLNISGKYLKKNISPKELCKPLLDAMSGGEKRSVQDRKQDEEYLRRIFDLPPEGVKEDG